MAKQGELPLNFDLPDVLMERFQKLKDREGRDKKILGALAIHNLTKLSVAEVCRDLQEYDDWLNGDSPANARADPGDSKPSGGAAGQAEKRPPG